MIDSLSQTLHQSIQVMSSQNQIVDQLERLSIIDAYIFQFYFNELKSNSPYLIHSKVGSVLHFNYLKQAATENKYLATSVLPILDLTKHNAFVGKAKRMVSMAQQAIRHNKLFGLESIQSSICQRRLRQMAGHHYLERCSKLSASSTWLLTAPLQKLHSTGMTTNASPLVVGPE
jgi:hypothetical protein